MADARSLKQGSVVWLTIPDPQGRNPKRRRCVVLSSNEAIFAGNNPLLVAVTTTIDPKFPEEYVALPYGPNALSGFRKKSAAHCIWAVRVAQGTAEVDSGIVRPELVHEIVARMRALGDRVRFQSV